MSYQRSIWNDLFLNVENVLKKVDFPLQSNPLDFHIKPDI